MLSFLPGLAVLRTWARLFPPQTQLCVGNDTQQVTAQSAEEPAGLFGFLPAARGALAGPGSRGNQGSHRGTRQKRGEPHDASPSCSSSSSPTLPWARDSSVAERATESAAGALKCQLEALGEGQRRGTLGHAAHRQALGGQRTGCAGADGGKLQGEREGASTHL